MVDASLRVAVSMLALAMTVPGSAQQPLLSPEAAVSRQRADRHGRCASRARDRRPPSLARPRLRPELLAHGSRRRDGAGISYMVENGRITRIDVRTPPGGRCLRSRRRGIGIGSTRPTSGAATAAAVFRRERHVQAQRRRPLGHGGGDPALGIVLSLSGGRLSTSGPGVASHTTPKYCS